MAIKWYAETKNFAGEWKPCVFHSDEEPNGRTHTGYKIKLNNVQPVSDSMSDKTLDELFAHFNESTTDAP